MLPNIIFIQMNELNFDIVKKYTKIIKLPNFERLMNEFKLITESEKEYENLEPWIQWYSFYTGLKFKDHKVHKLGDSSYANHKNILNDLEDLEFKIGCISPMNLINNLKSPSFFVPDPWTISKTDGSFTSNALHKTISQVVNDNSQNKIGFYSIIVIIYYYLFYTSITGKIRLFTMAIKSLGKKWLRVNFLDAFLNEIFIKLIQINKTNFSMIFFNSLAHLQHHYLHNSKVNQLKPNPEWLISKGDDPILKGLIEMDLNLQSLYELARKKNATLIIATGLSQVPYKQKTFYYRLKNHNSFLKLLGISYKNISPRMTRDFEIKFDDTKQRDSAFKAFKSIKINSTKAFNLIEKRQDSLFITLTYDQEINENTELSFNNFIWKAKDLIVFVAVKNGQHYSRGWLFSSEKLLKSSKDIVNVSELRNIMLNYVKQFT